MAGETNPKACVRPALRRALGFLGRVQLESGELPSSWYRDAGLSGQGVLDASPFVTTFALYALSWMRDDAAARPLADRAAAFLLRERRSGRVWGYTAMSNRFPVEPDLDDTCCAAFILRRCGLYSAAENESVILSNRTPEGLFKTWLREPAAFNDVDSVVNANVLLYLGERPETRGVIAWLNGLLLDGTEMGSTWYYLDALALHYAASRAFAHGCEGLAASREAVVARILARQGTDGSFGDELQTALALCTLANYGHASPALAAAVAWLVSVQQPDGSWPKRAFYSGPGPPWPTQIWWGSESLTTSFCLEALVRTGAANAGSRRS